MLLTVLIVRFLLVLVIVYLPVWFAFCFGLFIDLVALVCISRCNSVVVQFLFFVVLSLVCYKYVCVCA